MISRMIEVMVRHAKITLIVVAVLTGVFAYFIPGIEFSSTTENFFIKGDPEKSFFDEVKKTFGNDGITVIAMVSPAGENIFDQERMSRLFRVTEKIEGIAGVRKVVSLANVERIHGSGMSINITPLMKSIPESREEWAALKSSLSENPMYERNLVSPDRRAAAINVLIEDFDKDESRYYGIMDQITGILNQETGPEKFYVSGIAATSTETNRAIIHDLKKFFPFTFLLIAVILAVSFRSVWGVVLPLGTVAIATVWTLGFMGMAGIPISMVTIVLPPLIATIGCAYVIHVISEYMEEAGVDATAEDIVSSSLNKVAVPMLVCGATTIIGFGSLILNGIPSIRGLGLAAVAGVLFSVVLAMTLAPAALSVLPRLKRAGDDEPEDRKPGMLDDFLASLAEFDLKHRVLILAGCVGLGLAGLLGAFRIETNTDFLSFFKDDDPITVANKAQQEYLAGAAPYLVILDGRGPDTFKDPALLRRVDLFQTWLAAEVPGIDMSLSFVDYVKLLNKVFHKNDPAYFRVPDSRKEIAQLLLFYSFSGDPQDFAPYVTSDYSRANIMVRSRIVGSADTDRAIKKIENYAKGFFGNEASVKVTGTIRMVNKSANEVAEGQVKSIVICLVVIFLMMSVLFLSFRVGFLAMIPNVLPVLVLFGVMGFTGITLNFSTSLIACIAIGLGVDDTIHLLSRYSKELKERIDAEDAVRGTVRVLGKPVIYTSVSLFLGFTIIAGSDFVPIMQFGLLTGLTVLVCLAADLVMLPALISTVRVTTLWEHVRLGVGQQTRADVRLFQGLSGPQEKVATLMGVFGFYNQGEEIIRKGDEVKDLFVILEGRVTVSGDDEDEKQLVPEGVEFGLMPGDEPRTAEATFTARTKSKLLVINPVTMDRLRTAYPKIAERISRNIEMIRRD